MANLNSDDEETARARAEAEAQAELEIEMETHTPKTPAERAAIAMGAIRNATSDFASQTGDAIWSGIKAIPESIGALGGAMIDAGKDPTSYQYPMGLLANTATNVVSKIPKEARGRSLGAAIGTGVGALGGPLAAATIPLGAGAGSAIGDMLSGNSTDDTYKNMVSNITATGVTELIPRAANTATTAAGKIVGKVSPSEEFNLYKLRNLPASTGRIMNRGLRRTAKDKWLADEIEGVQDHFIENGEELLKNTASGDNVADFQQFQKNLETFKTNAKTTKKDIINRMAGAESAYNESLSANGELTPESAAGIKATDLDLGWFDSQTKVAANPGEYLKVKADLDNFVNTSQFSAPGGGVAPSSNAVPKNPTLADAMQKLDQIDDTIKQWKGYDDATLANSGKQESLVTDKLSALRAGRGQLAEAIYNHIKRTMGEGTAEKFADSNLSIRTAITYEDAAHDFLGDVGESLGRGSAGSLNQNVNPTETIMGIASPQKFLAKLTSPMSSRSAKLGAAYKQLGATVRDLENIIAWKNGAPAPLSRDWRLIKNNPSALAAIKNMAVGMGILQNPLMFDSAPELGKKQITDQVIDTNPGAFEAPAYGMNSLRGEEFSGAMAGLDMAAYAKDVKDDKNISDSKRAEVLGALANGKFIPKTENPVVLKDTIQAPDPIEAMRRALSTASMPDNVIPFPGTNSQPTDTQQMLEQMKRSMSLRDPVRSGG